MRKAVVIFSGGQDSTTCLYWAKKEFDEVEAITFQYGQKHRIEIAQSSVICRQASVRQTIFSIPVLDQIVESAMLRNGNTNGKDKKGLPASFVPNRNQLFITLAHAFAQKVNAEHLVIGVCQTDYSGYPDCRAQFIKLIQETSNAGSNSLIQIHTPIMHINKAETFALAQSLGCLREVIELSHTCYEGNHSKLHEWGYGCGICPACELRKNGWHEYGKLLSSQC